MNKILEKQNIGIKLILGLVGLIAVIAGFYPAIMKSLMLTDKDIPLDWYLIGGGFILAVGAYKYNTIIDGITNKFFPSKSKNNGQDVSN